MATHSSILAQRIPGTGETGGLPPMGSHRVKYDRSNLVAAAAEDSNVILKKKKKSNNNQKIWPNCLILQIEKEILESR